MRDRGDQPSVVRAALARGAPLGGVLLAVSLGLEFAGVTDMGVGSAVMFVVVFVTVWTLLSVRSGRR